MARLLPPDVDLVRGWRHTAADVVWQGVVWGRLGRADLAATHLDLVQAPALQPWIAAERGRLARELGLHAHAEAVECRALERAEDAVDVAMLRISLTADAVGVGEVDRAVERLAAARVAVAASPDGPRAARQRLRLGWVEVEVGALSGAGTPAVVGRRLARWDPGSGGVVQPDDARHGTAFHRAKGCLFAGVVRDDDRLLDAAAVEAPPILAWAVALARADRGRAGALEDARAAWARIVPSPGWADEVAATPTARRLTATSGRAGGRGRLDGGRGAGC
jgi:hypothetical protein